MRESDTNDMTDTTDMTESTGMTDMTEITETDRVHLRRCVALARQAVATGHQPFGSVLVSSDGRVLREAHNRTGTGDPTAHPEFALARWAAKNLPAEARAASTLYTSGEHCVMCAAAHAWCGLGRIVYASSTEQLLAWLDDLGAPPPPFSPMSLRAILGEEAAILGPDEGFAEEIRALHVAAHSR